jgi:two-component SAPR family response regulator
VDEWDRVQPNELEVTLKKLIVEIGDAHIILMGRGMPRFMHHPSELRQLSCLVPIYQAAMLLDYQRRDEKNILLEVYSLGSGTALVNGRPILDWGGDLPRSLFFYLVDRGIATRNDIFQAFWPTMTVREATNVFHVTKRKISELLGVDLTIYWSGFYRLSQQIDLVYDVALFGEAVQNSPVAQPDESENLLAQAIQHYHGDYLASLDGTIPWVQKRRTELRQTYSETLINLARSTEQNSDTRKALGFYIRAYATNPQREDVAGNIMKLYAQLGFNADALAIYDRLERELMNNLNISPAQWIQKLAMEIRSDEKAAVYTS